MFAFAALNPVAFSKGWEHRAQARQEEERSIAVGAGEEVSSWIATLGKEHIPTKELARRKVVQKKVSELREAMGEDIDKADARDYLRRIIDVTGHEGELLR